MLFFFGFKWSSTHYATILHYSVVYKALKFSIVQING